LVLCVIISFSEVVLKLIGGILQIVVTHPIQFIIIVGIIIAAHYASIDPNFWRI
jgi:hypothetical protein